MTEKSMTEKVETMQALQPGTVIRFPIVVQGFIEMIGLKTVRVVVDPFDWEYAAWPRVSAYGDDKDIVQFEDSPAARRIEADADIVESLRAIAERKGMDVHTEWRISRGFNEGVTRRTSDE